MNWLTLLEGQLRAIYDLGGPVVLLLVGLSVISFAVILWKVWQYLRVGVGRHRKLHEAIRSWDGAKADDAETAVNASGNRLAAIFIASSSPGKARVEARANAHIARLEGGFRILDSIAQIAPLLGLFGTVLGMIDAFQALQDAGNSVDPSVLAGGIWVALLTTAAGLAVAMPTSIALTYFESRVARERGLAETAIEAKFGSGFSGAA